MLGLSLINIIRIGIEINEKIDAREEYLLKKAIESHKKTKKRPKIKLTANIKPMYVAIPLPPLNFNQNGNRCPIIAMLPKI